MVEKPPLGDCVHALAIGNPPVLDKAGIADGKPGASVGVLGGMSVISAPPKFGTWKSSGKIVETAAVNANEISGRSSGLIVGKLVAVAVGVLVMVALGLTLGSSVLVIVTLGLSVAVVVAVKVGVNEAGKVCTDCTRDVGGASVKVGKRTCVGNSLDAGEHAPNNKSGMMSHRK